MLNANGYHGAYYIRYYNAYNTSTAMRIEYPIVYLSGTTFSGTYTNNAWYALQGGCGNSNGIASCTAVCKALSRTYVGISSSCTPVYSGSVTSYVTPDRCTYTAADTTATPWADYGAASTCVNPMVYCDCSL
ncbi:hypothetical protein I4U23_007233 [Adineta vaga]|nr:hypothetical protein I4U23_007233 [Adineta vaga]